ncbi:hypothetical protein TanjilG_30962 [Lupinus angustifolius]|uniref:Uncharacterized protein n=1 Tax=Lupinus angustifolius TaxID=3871 RepID=A0A1J7GSW5_LUPAN|nr:PREDICTED: uncharacterized protein LOC109357936 [Lupinus angustifolius]OIW03542.1 hypothetical protein TanjilG_30962 [Lupinus angustifolius]
MNEQRRKEKEQDNVNNNMFSEEEREVAELLVELPRLILDLEAPLLSLLPFTWGCKRIRSAIQDYTPTKCAAVVADAPPPLHHGGVTVAPPCEAASSPATPLSLSLTESSDKGKKSLPCKASLRRQKEYYVKSVEDLTKSKASLNIEIDNVKRYSEQLKAFNLKLKARKQELGYRYSSNKSEVRKPNLGIGLPMQLVYASVHTPNSMAENQQQQQYVLMLNQTCGQSQIRNTECIAQFQYLSGHHPTTSLPIPSSSSSPNSSNAELDLVNNTMGPIGILDLNVSSEELIHVDSFQPLDVNVVNKDLNRAIAAQARQRRIQINKLRESHRK